MIYNVYSVHDVKTTFAAPFVDTSDESAIRGFGYAFVSNPSLITFAPADFRLYRIGKFDSDSGYLTDELPQFICDATRFSKEVTNEKFS